MHALSVKYRQLQRSARSTVIYNVKQLTQDDCVPICALSWRRRSEMTICPKILSRAGPEPKKELISSNLSIISYKGIKRE